MKMCLISLTAHIAISNATLGTYFQISLIAYSSFKHLQIRVVI